MIILVQGCLPLKTFKANPPVLDSIFTGNFVDDYGNRYSIHNNKWIQHGAGRYNILSYHADGPYLICQNDASNKKEAGLFTRIDLMQFKDMAPWQWGFCLTAFKAPTADSAQATAAANRATPKTGCGGFPFSRMKRE